MSKEIEETRKHRHAQKLLEEYMKTVAQQMRDRGLYYIIAVVDPRTETSAMGCEGRTNHIELMTNVIVGTAMKALVRDGMSARRRLSEIDPDYETWSDPQKP